MKRKHKKLLIAAAASGLSAGIAHAGAIAPGDLVVYQVGDGTNPAVAGSSPVYIQEINPSLLSQTSPVQSFDISTMASGALYATNEGSDGDLALSNNGTQLSFTGWTYGGEAATAALSADPNHSQAGVGTLDFNGNYAEPTTLTPFLAPGNTTTEQVRSAYSADGVNYYVGDKLGIFTNNGTAPLSGSANTRPIKAFGGTTYGLQASASAPVAGVLTPSSPSPTTASLTYTNPTGVPDDANAIDFTLLSSGTTPGVYDTLYYTSSKGIVKYAFNGSTWTTEGTDTFAGKKLTGIAAVAAVGGGVDLFVTNDPGSGVAPSVEEFVDSAAYNATINAPTFTTLYTAPLATDDLQGISTAPVPEPASAGLLVLGGATLGLWRKRRPTRKNPTA